MEPKPMQMEVNYHSRSKWSEDEAVVERSGAVCGNSWVGYAVCLFHFCNSAIFPHFLKKFNIQLKELDKKRIDKIKDETELKISIF